MAMTKLFRQDPNKKYFTIAENLNMEKMLNNKLSWLMGKSMSGFFPEITINITSTKPPADFFDLGASLFVGSMALCDILKEFHVNAEFFELTALQRRKPLKAKRYFHINPLDVVDCIDRNKSEYEMETAVGYTDIISSIDHLELDEGKAAGHHFFLLANCWDRSFV